MAFFRPRILILGVVLQINSSQKQSISKLKGACGVAWVVLDMCGLQWRAMRKHWGDNGSSLTASFAVELLAVRGG